ncbi:MAG TPA: hypothetical protein VF451_06690 [Acidobacteriota bacterium]
MDNGHLTDEQFQEILDARVLLSGPILPLHLGTCAHCRKRLESFRRLYAGLAGDPGFVLSPSFADAVLGKIPAASPLLWQRPAVKIALAASSGAAMLAGLLIFVDMRPLASGALQVLAGLKSAFLPLGGQAQQLLARLGGSARPFLLGGLGLFIASIIERLLQQQKLRQGH